MRAAPKSVPPQNSRVPKSELLATLPTMFLPSTPHSAYWGPCRLTGANAGAARGRREASRGEFGRYPVF